ncbi:nucleoside 2-deoxyribosyltransferase [Leptospira alstonii]|uniref:nucleoside 2-deoxyribosyltransferase n=1 Tax=Leptospira alstonii TaxID=28452 RepID=UPI001E411739|nr:nucleoside 2-deoxyribosyltransferase [Leptospira alstonii]
MRSTRNSFNRRLTERLRIFFENDLSCGTGSIFNANSISVLQDRKSLCASFGFDALSPFDSEIPVDHERNIELARKIFLGNIELIQRADIVLANIFLKICS